MSEIVILYCCFCWTKLANYRAFLKQDNNKRTISTREGPFVCSFCYLNFPMSRQQLYRHILPVSDKLVEKLRSMSIPTFW